MGIRFIYGRAGVGKTTYCFNQIKNRIHTEEKIIYIVPEQYTFQRETELLRSVTERGLLNTQVLSFKRMAHRVFNTCKGRAHISMQDTGKSMLIHKILHENYDDLNYFNKISKTQGFNKIVSDILTEFKKYNISSNLIDEKIEKIDDSALKNKLQDLSLLLNKYNSSLEKNIIDSDDELTYLANLLNQCDIYDGAVIYIDEFTTFTPQQLNVIKALAKRCKEINITLCMDSPTKDVNIEVTDVFNVIKNTENRILEMMKEESIEYLKPIDINGNINNRFSNSAELKHLEEHYYAYPFKRYLEKPHNLRLYKANNSYDEMENVAKEILRLVRDKNYRYRDISVVCRNIDDYEKITTVIFNEYDIPFFLDKKIQILSNPMIILILSAFEIYLKNWSYESVFKYLKSGLTGIKREDIDKLENYILANGIKGYKWTGKLEHNEENEEIINIMINVREPLMKFHKVISNKNSIKVVCIGIYEFLLDINVFDRIKLWIEKFGNNKITSKVMEYEQVPQIVIDILEQAVEVLGEEIVEADEIYKILLAGFENKELGVIPVALDQVNIGDITRIKGRDVKALFIVGVNDGILPSANKDEGILSDKDREILADNDIVISSTTKAKAFEEQFMVYTAITLSSKYLMVSYSMADFEGKSLRPSIVIPRIKRLFPKLEEESSLYNIVDQNDKYFKITSRIPTFNELILALRRSYDNEDIEPYWNDAYLWFSNKEEFKNKAGYIFEGLKYSNKSENISQEIINDLYETESGKFMFNISRLEKYAQCPFSYFVQYGLKAKDRKIYEFSAPDLGSFMHEILDKFTNKIKEEKIQWSELNSDKCREIVNNLVKEKLDKDENSILNSSKKYKYFTDRFKRVITKSVSIISEQMRKGQFEIFSNEFSFGPYSDGAPIKLSLPSGQDVYLTGRIDRIDKLNMNGNTYIRVVDYKSGAKKFDLNELYYGLQIQLLVYLDAILRNSKYILKTQAMPGAILYFKIDDPIIKSKKELENSEVTKQVLEKLKMNGLLLKDAELVRAMDNDMETYSLIIPAAFKKDGDFSSNSSVITEEQFDILREYVNDKMVELCGEMLSGKIKIEPCKSSVMAYCDYCDYSSICQFDTSIKDNKYKLIFKKDENELWDRMVKKIGGNVDE